jgi:hypothetical protein
MINSYKDLKLKFNNKIGDPVLKLASWRLQHGAPNSVVLIGLLIAGIFLSLFATINFRMIADFAS